MVKHTQTIRRQQTTNCLNVFYHFVGLALKELTFFCNSTVVVSSTSKVLCDSILILLYIVKSKSINSLVMKFSRCWILNTSKNITQFYEKPKHSYCVLSGDSCGLSNVKFCKDFSVSINLCLSSTQSFKTESSPLCVENDEWLSSLIRRKYFLDSISRRVDDGLTEKSSSEGLYLSGLLSTKF